MAAVYGSYLPFPATEVERMERGDPRASLESRYPTLHDYIEKLVKVTGSLVEQRLLLDEDAARCIAEAGDVTLPWPT